MWSKESKSTVIWSFVSHPIAGMPLFHCWVLVLLYRWRSSCFILYMKTFVSQHFHSCRLWSSNHILFLLQAFFSGNKNNTFATSQLTHNWIIEFFQIYFGANMIAWLLLRSTLLRPQPFKFFVRIFVTIISDTLLGHHGWWKLVLGVWVGSSWGSWRGNTCHRQQRQRILQG